MSCSGWETVQKPRQIRDQYGAVKLCTRRGRRLLAASEKALKQVRFSDKEIPVDAPVLFSSRCWPIPHSSLNASPRMMEMFVCLSQGDFSSMLMSVNRPQGQIRGCRQEHNDRYSRHGGSCCRCCWRLSGQGRTRWRWKSHPLRTGGDCQVMRICDCWAVYKYRSVLRAADVPCEQLGAGLDGSSCVAAGAAAIAVDVAQ